MDKALAYISDCDMATSRQACSATCCLAFRPGSPPSTARTSKTTAPKRPSGSTPPPVGTRVAQLMGAVAGRDIETVAAMGQLRTVVRTLATQDLAPDELLTRSVGARVAPSSGLLAEPRGMGQHM
ncbi:SpoIIE family protein phosphatase [Streptacidiphilus sp. BW17]|uniref:SpoIIE family protein phosphatase n=1 Tax=Streptacidiphilus sp. BW17 TaxID=3156274 RepID=UPI0035147F74